MNAAPPPLTVLILGARGFIGRHLAEALAARGHHVLGTARRAGPATIAADFTRDLSPAVWLPRLAGVDVVVNAVGILRETPSQTFAALHDAAPRAVFEAATRAGVKRIVQISALGADADARSAYHLSKRAADEALRALPIDSAIVQPSIVFGTGGASARLFSLMAGAPVTALPGRGEQRIQPIHIDDLVAALVALVEGRAAELPLAVKAAAHRSLVAGAAPHSLTLPLVGPEPLTLRDWLIRLRAALGIAGRPRFLPVPAALMRPIAALGDRWHALPIDSASLGMLERGNTADPAATTALLGHPPRPVGSFVSPDLQALAALRAQLDWLLPLLRVAIAAVWIWTAIVSLGLYPVAASLDLLARTGITGQAGVIALVGAALLDLAFGIACLWPGRPRWLWAAQAALIAGYTLVITWRLPEFWLHPYGPILKNLPMLAALWLLHRLDRSA
ncbi:SDR family oxidoreductase [Derxia gummosa]|uniref:SDR family oxidoreductase n=1 Tax=Derxia gummosa DSM 723 TaxID=1121388 RepID=A0A8B6X435_9BURK|nr:SDR family oxidoreductase [Derxia gummosa]